MVVGCHPLQRLRKVIELLPDPAELPFWQELVQISNLLAPSATPQGLRIT